MQFSEEQYEHFKVKSVRGRYITNQHLEKYLSASAANFEVTVLGSSVLGKEIKSIHIGNGPVKLLLWSQMHGNESTTTKAALDLINFLKSSEPLATALRSKCRLLLIPIVNPDGAEQYTRVNASGIDLNRDAQQLSQPESRVLLKVFEDFQPDYCFNLHDQRTIFSVGDTAKPATVSFLAPAYDTERNTSASRAQSMQLIVAMNNVLQNLIPGQVGRYDDTFNPNCVGDAFQMRNTPTVLVEAGHAPADYMRENTRKYVFFALLQAVQQITSGRVKDESLSDYTLIPENQKNFFDILVKNMHCINPKYAKAESAGILYKEVLEKDRIQFIPQLEKTGQLNSKYGHQFFNCELEADVLKLQDQPEVYMLLI